jgi:hypothetical protein
VQWWVDRRDKQTNFFNWDGFLTFRGVIYISTILTFVAMWILVNNTGGGIESPFAPLLVAPAILGPFIVRQREVLWILVGAATIIVLTADWNAPTRAAEPTTKLDHPGWGVYGVVTLILVVSATFISYVRSETDEPAWALVRQFVARLRGGGHHRARDRDAQLADGPLAQTIAPAGAMEDVGRVRSPERLSVEDDGLSDSDDAKPVDE